MILVAYKKKQWINDSGVLEAEILGITRQKIGKRNDVILFSVWIIALGGLLHLWLSRIMPSISKMTKTCLLSDLPHFSGARWTQRMSREMSEFDWDWAQQKRSTGLASLLAEHSLTNEHNMGSPSPTLLNFLHCLELPQLFTGCRAQGQVTGELKNSSHHLNSGENYTRFKENKSFTERWTLSRCWSSFTSITSFNMPQKPSKVIKWTSEQGTNDLLKVIYLGMHQTPTWIQVLDGHVITLPGLAAPRKPRCESEGTPSESPGTCKVR